jgi:hypothetical protein
MQTPFFYIIRHIMSNKLYAGVRYAKDKCDSELFMTISGYQTTSKYVKALIKTDGLSSFKIERIRHFSNQDEAISYEARFLKRVDAMRNDNFLNRNNGGREFIYRSGWSHTEETKAKIKASNAGKKRSTETRLRIVESWKGREPMSDETRLKKSGWNHTDEAKERIGKSRKGFKHTDEAKAKIVAAHKGAKRSDEAKANMREACKNRLPASEESKEKRRLTWAAKKSLKNTDSLCLT